VLFSTQVSPCNRWRRGWTPPARRPKLSSACPCFPLVLAFAPQSRVQRASSLGRSSVSKRRWVRAKLRDPLSLHSFLCSSPSEHSASALLEPLDVPLAWDDAIVGTNGRSHSKRPFSISSPRSLRRTTATITHARSFRNSPPASNRAAVSFAGSLQGPPDSPMAGCMNGALACLAQAYLHRQY
jgi:hypothetical protein